MARPADVVVDETPLDGPEIDVPARIGWLLRISRQVAGVSLAEVADRLAAGGSGASVPVLSRLEKYGGRNGQVIDAYEEALGLEPGRLRAPIDLVCRGFGYAPVDRAPLPVRPPVLDEFDRVVAAVEGASPTGGDWLALARMHDAALPFGVTGGRMRPMLERLAGEAGRSVGLAFVARQEALRRLRCTPYGDLVEELARRQAADAETQVHVDLASVVAERPTPGVLRWAAELLSSESFLAARGAALAIERMAAIGGLGPQDWFAVVPALGEATRRAAGDVNRQAALSSVVHALPLPARRALSASVDTPLPRPRVPSSWTPTRRNRHYAYAEQLAHTVSEDLDVGDQPMLARLLFEVLFDFRTTRTVSAATLLLASPFDTALRRALQFAVLEAPDETTRAGALAAAANMPMAWEGCNLSAWLSTDSTEVLAGALVFAGQGGVALPEEVLVAALGNPVLRDRATYSAGMAAHPVLQRWVEDETLPRRVRAAAAWWLREGGRIVT